MRGSSFRGDRRVPRFLALLPAVAAACGGGGGTDVAGEDAAIDIQIIAVELATILEGIKSAADSMQAGALEELTINTGGALVILRIVNPEYFLAMAFKSTANFGKARYYMRLAAPKLKEQL